MDKNILIIIGSPRSKRSNSDVISNSLKYKLVNKNLSCSKIYLGKMINEKNTIIDEVNKSDEIILISPIYENSVPSIGLEFFETIFENKDRLINKNRKLFVITNSGFPEVEAGECAITTCSLFARNMNFKWLGGINVAPGTLIDGGELGKTYKKLILALNIIAENISNDKEISKEVFKLVSKPFISPLIYRFAGIILQNKTIKNIGKDAFFAKPLKI
jgi:multimeric flavodoxin WrbA